MNELQPTIDDRTRLDVLKSIFKPKNNVPAQNSPIVEANTRPQTAPAPKEYTGDENFMDLMEQVVAKQEKQAKEDSVKLNEVKETIIKGLRMDILDDLKF